jgi:hypothetical protein
MKKDKQTLKDNEIPGIIQKMRELCKRRPEVYKLLSPFERVILGDLEGVEGAAALSASKRKNV